MMKETTHENMTVIIPTMFSLTSLFCLVLISLESAHAVIWPLQHRVASTKMCTYVALLLPGQVV